NSAGAVNENCPQNLPQSWRLSEQEPGRSRGRGSDGDEVPLRSGQVEVAEVVAGLAAVAQGHGDVTVGVAGAVELVADHDRARRELADLLVGEPDLLEAGVTRQHVRVHVSGGLPRDPAEAGVGQRVRHALGAPYAGVQAPSGRLRRLRETGRRTAELAGAHAAGARGRRKATRPRGPLEGVPGRAADLQGRPG